MGRQVRCITNEIKDNTAGRYKKEGMLQGENIRSSRKGTARQRVCRTCCGAKA